MKAKVLSLNGGGIRGIITCKILVALEERLKARVGKDIKIVEKFTTVSGTSIGGIIAMLLLLTENGEPKYSAKNVLDIMLKEYSEIFKPDSSWNLWGYERPKYDLSGIEKLGNKYALSANMDQLYRDCIIPVYNLDTRRPYFFTRSSQFFVKEVGKCVGAAPSYFQIPEIFDINGAAYHFMDGGVVCNNPSMIAVTHILEREKLHASEFFVVNVGTGQPNDNLPFNKVKNWGKLSWADPISSLLIDSSASCVCSQLSNILHENFTELNPPLKLSSEALDCCTATNIKNLQIDTETYLNLPEIIVKLDLVVDRLLQ